MRQRAGIGGVERFRAERTEPAAWLLEALRITAGEDHLGALRPSAPGRLQPDSRAAADHDDGLPEQFRLAAGGTSGRGGAHDPEAMIPGFTGT